MTHIRLFGMSCAFSDASVLDFIRGRMATSNLLQHVHITFDRLMEFDILPELQPLISASKSNYSTAILRFSTSMWVAIYCDCLNV